ncbi:MAG: hypothetical protein WBA57_13430 [Elainellaceae cyanobacterium]
MISPDSDSQRLTTRRLPKHPLWFRLALYFVFGVSLINFIWVNSSSGIL